MPSYDEKIGVKIAGCARNDPRRITGLNKYARRCACGFLKIDYFRFNLLRN